MPKLQGVHNIIRGYSGYSSEGGGCEIGFRAQKKPQTQWILAILNDSKNSSVYRKMFASNNLSMLDD